MPTPDATLMTHSTTDGDAWRGGLSVRRVLAPVFEHAGVVISVSMALALVVVAYAGLRPRQFDAQLSFSTVGSARLGSLGSSLPAALLAATSSTGLQATPALLARLVRSHNVEVRVARQHVPKRGDSTVADLLMREHTGGLADAKVADQVARAVRVESDRETGLVTVSARHADSALARVMVQRVVDEVTSVFQEAVKVHASDTKSALTQRFEAAATRLRAAEENAREFANRNRVVAPFSPATIERDRFARELSLAQSLYEQVSVERESARSRELDEAPAVVVVDPIPRELIPVGRNIIWKGLVALILGSVIVAGIFVTADLLRRPSMSPQDERVRFSRALATLPVVRRFVH